MQTKGQWQDWGLAMAGLASLFWLSRVCYPTYDDGWNLHLLHQLSVGDASQLWHHGAPLFYLLWFPFFKAGLGYEQLCYLNAFLGLLGLGLITRWALPKKPSNSILLFLVCLEAASPVVVVNFFCFTVEAGGLAFLGLGLARKTSFWKGFWLVVAALYNYKLGLAGGLVLLTLLWQEGPSNRFSYLKFFASGAALPIVAALSVFICLNPASLWLKPLATYVGLFGRNANPDAANLGLDLLFYLHYLLDWENGLLWASGFIAAVFIWFRLPAQRQKLVFLLVWLLIGLFLPKAPRWLLPAWPILVAQFAFFMQRATLYVRLGVYGLLAGTAFFQLNQSIIPYVKNQNQTTLLSFKNWSQSDTLATYLSTYPYLTAPGLPLKILRKNDPVPPKTAFLWADGYAYLAGYTGRLLINTNTNTYTRQQGEQPTNAIPILWLEHTEYNGLTYQQTIDRWRKYRSACTSQVLLEAR